MTGGDTLSAAQRRSIEDSCAARNDSLDALEALCALPDLPTPLKLRFEHLLKLEDSVDILSFAFVAGELRGRAKPVKMYLKKVAAVPARYFDQCPISVTFRHGWPILSLGSDKPSMTEGGGESISAPGGR